MEPGRLSVSYVGFRASGLGDLVVVKFNPSFIAYEAAMSCETTGFP
jgi:hypothetical protein